MMEKTMENNRVSVIGEVASEFTFSHEVYGEGFYLTTVLVNRLSNQVDEIPLMVSERLMRLLVSSGPLTGTRGTVTAWYFLYLPGK